MRVRTNINPAFFNPAGNGFVPEGAGAFRPLNRVRETTAGFSPGARTSTAP